MFFHWSLSDSKSLQGSRTRLSILADLNTVISMISILPQISYSSSLFLKPLGTVLSAPITIGITVPRMFQSLFQLSNKVYVFVYFFAVLIFLSRFRRNDKMLYMTSSFLLLINTTVDLVFLTGLSDSRKCYTFQGQILISGIIPSG